MAEMKDHEHLIAEMANGDQIRVCVLDMVAGGARVVIKPGYERFVPAARLSPDNHRDFQVEVS